MAREDVPIALVLQQHPGYLKTDTVRSVGPGIARFLDDCKKIRAGTARGHQTKFDMIQAPFLFQTEAFNLALPNDGLQTTV